MTTDIAGFGVSVRLVASTTLPVGVTLTEFADDADPIDSPAVQITDQGMDVNGNMKNWSTANPVPLTMNLTPNTDEDRTLSALFQANRPSAGSNPANDVITVVISYPDGKRATFADGRIKSGMAAKSISSDGRQKSKPYEFAFQTYTETF